MTHRENDSILEDVANGRFYNSFSFLGLHMIDDGFVIRVFQPKASSVRVKDYHKGVILGSMNKVHENGIFELHLKDVKEYFLWSLLVTEDKEEKEVFDAYAFASTISEEDRWLIGENNHHYNYKVFGAHIVDLQEVSGTRFCVWAPNAKRVSVVGDFNNWDGRVHVMRVHHNIGIWEIFIPHVSYDSHYKYEILDSNGHLLPLKADPYAFASQLRPNTASVVKGLSKYVWSDDAWMQERKTKHHVNAPISIYEVHAPSWAKNLQEGGRNLYWRELADKLIPYVKSMNYTHIEFLPVSEYPFDGSWGYQPIGLFSPTSRMGSADDLRYFIDMAHQAGIGIIIDWVPAHFPKDEHGLARFDGTCLYEHADARQGEHRDWGTLIYNFGRAEVISFLISNAIYWFEEFHIDGIRVDAVASMLYLDYSKEDGDWVANIYGGRENLEAVAFLKKLNELIYKYYPDVLTVAEESTSWSGVSKPTWLGGLGFGFKWNMGWMNDGLEYIKKPPIHRSYHHGELTFSFVYAFSENFVLPISHDEVVHGKGSLLARMPGDMWQRFANMRVYLSYMFMHPGKKLLFMGCDIAQSDEWQHDSSVQWHLMQYPEHEGINKLVADLNKLYQEREELFENECSSDNFQWIDLHDSQNSILSWMRTSNSGKFLICIMNFTPVVRKGYRIGVPKLGKYKEIFNSDSVKYSGSGYIYNADIIAEEISWQYRDYSIELDIPPLAAVMLSFDGD